MNTEQGYLLLVEDDLDILALLETTLMFKDYRVLTAQNGVEALELIQKEHPMIVVADIMMPHLDGFGLLHRLRIDPDTRNIPVIFITATYVAPDDREFALRLGLTQFIQKPVDLGTLLDTIEKLLNLGPHVAVAPQDEFKFYDGFRQRLETKLDEKMKQIIRDEHLLGSHPETSNQDLQDSIRRAFRERKELDTLLEQVQKQIDRLGGE